MESYSGFEMHSVVFSWQYFGQLHCEKGRATKNKEREKVPTKQVLKFTKIQPRCREMKTIFVSADVYHSTWGNREDKAGKKIQVV